MKNNLMESWKEYKSLVIFLILMFIFRSAIADWNDVPTGSMNPTIVEGDRIYVNKMAYDIRLPFTLISLIKLSDPKRGDIIVFESEVSGKRLVKRVIGVPGDVIELKNNQLSINGRAVLYANIDQTDATIDKLESLLGVDHLIRVNKNGSSMSNFSSVQVPLKHYLAMGDNRDNSADSRAIGFIPRGEIVGKSTSVIFSLNYDNYFLPRLNRFFHKF